MDKIRSTEEAVENLENDRQNGARVLATNALIALRTLVQLYDQADLTSDNLWHRCRVDAYRMARARPSMGSAITSTLTSALNKIQMKWKDETEAGDDDAGRMVHLATQVLDELISDRKASSDRLARSFEEQLRTLPAVSNRGQKGTVKILTLSSSSSLEACLFHAVTIYRHVHWTVNVLESRPAMEGASFAGKLLGDLIDAGCGDNVEVVLAPESHVCILARNIDILLLGADHVSGDGDVSNKMGSMSAVLATKTCSKGKVVVITESDKIARPGSLEGHADEEGDPKEVIDAWPADTQDRLRRLQANNLVVRNIYFEWIAKECVDVYITEMGLLSTDDIHAASIEKGELEDEIFDASIKKS